MNEIEKELSKGSLFEEFVKFHLNSELQPYQKQLISFIENKRRSDTSLEDEFRTQYMLQPLQIGKTFKNTKRENGKISVECIKERPPKISFMILDDPMNEN